MSVLRGSIPSLCASVSEVNIFMNLVLQGLISGKMNHYKMKLLMQKLVEYCERKIIQVTGESHLTHETLLNDILSLGKEVGNMTSIISCVSEQQWTDLSQIEISLQNFVKCVESVIMFARSIISTIESEEFEIAMEDFKHVPIPDNIINISNKELDKFKF